MLLAGERAHGLLRMPRAISSAAVVHGLLAVSAEESEAGLRLDAQEARHECVAWRLESDWAQRRAMLRAT